MKTLLALVVIVLGALPAVYAGWPGLAPGWFDAVWQGLPAGVLAMSALMAVFVILAALCSAASRRRSAETEQAQ